MAKNKKSFHKDILKRTSKSFLAALMVVKNMKNVTVEPLPGRTPSKAFMSALAAVRKLRSKKEKK